MKFEIRPKDRILLVVACSALIVVLMFRLGILPMIEACEAEKIEYEEKCAQAERMQELLDDAPANEARITEGLATLDKMSEFCYELMENRQVDELVTGVALAHGLFPSHLEISERTAAVPGAYLYSGDRAAGNLGTEEDVEAMAPGTADNLGEDSDASEVQEERGAIRKVEASIAMNGSEGNMKAFLNDIEANYPAVHVKSFEMSENLYMSTELQPVTETQMRVVLEIYMYNRPEEQ